MDITSKEFDATMKTNILRAVLDHQGGDAASEARRHDPAGQPAELASIHVQLAAPDATYATGQVYGAAGGSGQP